jgi:hypothetical protein
MKRWQKILDNKYNYLLVIEVLLLIAYPILYVRETKFPIITLLLLIALVPALNVALKFRYFLFVMAIGMFAFILNLIIRYRADRFTDPAKFVLIAIESLFLLLAIVILAKKIYSRRVVTADTIKGGISIYILIGFLWTTFYLMMLFLDGHALSNISDPVWDCFYFSFTTLTTLGYGDITPTTSYARALAFLEGIVGPIFMVVFMTKLVVLNIESSLREGR